MHKKRTTLSDRSSPFVLSVLSGKGGVGKSTASVNLADTLNRMGYRVALIDADIGLSNCATLMNETVSATVAQWVKGYCSLEDLSHITHDITLVTGSNDPAMVFDIELLMDALDQVVVHLSQHHDFIIIDTPAGAGEITLWALDRSALGTLILVDEPTAVSDVYRLCKYIYSIDPDFPFATLVNQAEDSVSAEDTYNRFNSILKYFLNREIPFLGFIPKSDCVKLSIQNQQPFYQLPQGNEELVHEVNFIAQNVVSIAYSNSQFTQMQLPTE